MQKISGHICDNCRTVFKPDEPIVELCTKCANTVWCVFEIYEDLDTETLSAICNSKEVAEEFVKKQKQINEELLCDPIDYHILEYTLFNNDFINN